MRIYYIHRVGKWKKRLLTLQHNHDVVTMEEGEFGFKITARYTTSAPEITLDSSNEIDVDEAYEVLGEDLPQILDELKSGEMWGKK